MFELINEYASIINFALLISLITYTFRVFKVLLKNKDETINRLSKELEFSQSMEYDKGKEKFESIKKQTEDEKKRYRENTLKELENEMVIAVTKKEGEIEMKLQVQIDIFKKLINDLEKDDQFEYYPIKEEEIIGKYKIHGYNPFDNKNEFRYEGQLYLEKKGKLIHANWEIASGKQKYKGIGFLNGRVLAIHYWDKKNEDGIVLYNIDSKNILRGQWTGKGTENIGLEIGERNYKA